MIQVPGYLIKREIGKGGMATVYLAVQASLDREVALKVMQPTLANDPNFSRRFMQEARTLASLSHPHIVAVYDVGVTEAQLHYFSMQHLPGGDFAHRIRDGVGETEVVRVLAGVARALGFAHQRGFVHRDVSPANILYDASGHPVLTDFGIARAVARTSRLTNAGVSVGTSQYMSPEQARGADVDARSDIYSLGCVAYEALTGKPPYGGDDGFAIAYAHVFEPIPRLPENLAHWQPLVDRALAKNAAERYANLDEFLEALARVGAAPLPVEPGPEPEVFDDSDFASFVEAHRTQPIPAELLGVLPPAAVAPEPASATSRAPERPAAASGAEPTRQRRARTIGIAAGALALLVIVVFALTRSPPRDGGTERAPASVASDSAEPIATAVAARAESGSSATAPAAAPAGGGNAPSVSVDAATLPAPADDPAALRIAIATTAVDPVPELLALANADLAALRYTQPTGRNALERYELAAKIAERRRATRELERARTGVAAVASGYVELAEKRLGERNEPEFLALLERAERIAAKVPEGAAVGQRVRARRASLRDASIEAGRAAAREWDRPAAIAAFERALALDASSKDARRGLADAQRIGQPGFVFQDPGKDGQGPQMIVVGKLAVARTETTLGEFRRYWKARGARARGDRPACRDRESFFRGGSKSRSFESPGYPQTARHPVVCVAWADADGYARWLSTQTGKRYRLPTAAEWAALARGAAGASDCRANVGDSRYRSRFDARDAYGCDDRHAEAAPVASYDASAAGLYDLVGNVREWVADCAPGCREHVAIGSAWFSGRDAAQRAALGNGVAANTVGFRVVREID